MMVGYARDHAGDTYQMWNPNTGRVLVTRDVIWLGRMYYDPPSKVHGTVEAGKGVVVRLDHTISEEENFLEIENDVVAHEPIDVESDDTSTSILVLERESDLSDDDADTLMEDATTAELSVQG